VPRFRKGSDIPRRERIEGGRIRHRREISLSREPKPLKVSGGLRKLKVRNFDEKQVTNEDLKVQTLQV